MAEKAKVKIPTIAEMGGPSPENLKTISGLAAKQIQIEDEIVKLEEQLEAKGKELRRYSTDLIPDALKAAQVKGIELPDGTYVEVLPFITGNIKPENLEKAHAWLRKNNAGALIKTAFGIEFGMGAEKKVKAFLSLLKKAKTPFKMKEGVHVQTLRSFIRERLEAGKALPPSIEVVEVPTCKITRKKEG